MQQLTFTDQLLRTVSINFPPERIISLVPSQTELLFDLGLDAEIIGLTKFCNHPVEKVKGKVKVGGTKALDLPLIYSLKPDLIIGNKEENNQDQIEVLIQQYPVWMSDVKNLLSALDMISSIGKLTNSEEKANHLVDDIKQGFDQLSKIKHPLKVAYLIWQKPFMLAGKNTYIDSMLHHCGFINVTQSERYPEVDVDELGNAYVIMLSSEPYPFKQQHLQAIQLQCPNSRVILVDGEIFSWYGSRMLKAIPYFNKLITELI